LVLAAPIDGAAPVQTYTRIGFVSDERPLMDVEIWSDIACPWCYIGKRRFEAALERFEHRDEVNVTWRSFELDPDAPHERDGDRAERLAQKYGMTVEQAREAEHAVVAGEG
jgi:predicted DsbA family dithiol-disulfide isomerase